MKIAAVRLPHCPEEADLFIPAAFRPESSIKAEPVCGGIQLGTKPLIAEMCKLQTTVQLMARWIGKPQSRYFRSTILCYL